MKYWKSEYAEHTFREVSRRTSEWFPGIEFVQLEMFEQGKWVRISEVPSDQFEKTGMVTAKNPSTAKG